MLRALLAALCLLPLLSGPSDALSARRLLTMVGKAPTPTPPAYAYPTAVSLINMVPNGQSSLQASSWTKTNVQDATFATTILSPDGVTNAQKLIANTTSGGHQVTNTSVNHQASAVQYRCAVDVASTPGDYTRIDIQIASGGSGVAAPFDVVGGQVGAAPTTFGSGWSAATASASIQYAGTNASGQKFYRAILDVTTPATGATSFGCTAGLDSGTGVGALSNVFAGNGTRGLYVWQIKLTPTSAWSMGTTAFSDALTSSSTFDVTNSRAPGFHEYLNNTWPNAAEGSTQAWKNATATQAANLSWSPTLGTTLTQDVSGGFGNDLSTAVTDAIVVQTTAVTAVGSPTLSFGANNVPVGVTVGSKVYDNSSATPYASIPQGTTVQSVNAAAGTVTLSGNVTGTQVGSGDKIGFSANGYVGRTFTPPFLVDVTITSTVAQASLSNTSWPTEFSIAMEYLQGDACQNYIEYDNYEMTPTGAGTVKYQIGFHQWNTCAASPTQSNDTITPTPTITYGVPNRFTRLWIPIASNGGTNGIIQSYLNGVMIAGTEIVYNSGSASPAFALGETQHFPLILGTGTGLGTQWPATFLNLSVTCASSSCQTLH